MLKGWILCKSYALLFYFIFKDSKTKITPKLFVCANLNKSSTCLVVNFTNRFFSFEERSDNLNLRIEKEKKKRNLPCVV